jgi:thiomorpholine-carboxylate dehydrogenase
MMTRSGKAGRYGVMSAICGRVMGTKMVSIYPENSEVGLASHASIIQLFNADTGQALATMDGDVITEMRTAAVSALAAKVLSPKNATVLAVLGAGVQAGAHLEALPHIRQFDRVYVWSRNYESARRLAIQHGATVTKSISEAVSTADIVVTATSATNGVLLGHAMKAANLVIAVGAVHPQSRELDDIVMQGAVVVESREAAQTESGDIILSGATIYGELGQIVAGKLDIPQVSRKVFKSVGIAVEDVAAAHLAYQLILHGRNMLTKDVLSKPVPFSSR